MSSPEPYVSCIAMISALLSLMISMTRCGPTSSPSSRPPWRMFHERMLSSSLGESAYVGVGAA